MPSDRKTPEKRFFGHGAGNDYPIVVSSKAVGLRLRIRLRLLGWLGPVKTDQNFIPRMMPIYLNWCREHRCYYLDYPHSWRGELECPKCLRERLNIS